MNMVSILRRGRGVTTRHARDGTPTPRSTLTAASSPDTAPAARPQTRQYDSLGIQWHMPEKPHRYHLRRRPGRRRDATSRSPPCLRLVDGARPDCGPHRRRIAGLIGGGLRVSSAADCGSHRRRIAGLIGGATGRRGRGAARQGHRCRAWRGKWAGRPHTVPQRLATPFR
jgi:hypothetical protein